jgi:hypothetical protein
MVFEGMEKGEQVKGGKPKVVQSMTLQKAVDMGEYKPEYLSSFPEWHTLSKHVQFQFIKQGLENRRHQLLQQYGRISNVIDFRLKPELKGVLNNIDKQLEMVEKDFEKLSKTYSEC